MNINKARAFATRHHKGQKYNNKPYVTHATAVYRVIKLLCPLDFDLQAAALLHDILEETPVTLVALTEEFGQDIASLVNEVTKTEYNTFPHLKSRRGVILKFADRLCNLVNMDNWDEERQQKYIEKSTFWYI